LPSFTLVPPGIRDYISPVPEWAEWSQAERQAEAQRLYAEAGYSEEHPLEIEIRYTAGENNKKMALAAASLWKQILGVKATLLNEENKVFLQNRDQKILTQVFQSGWIGDYADPYSFLNLFRTGGGRNYYGYSNNLYDALLGEVEAERIPSRRRLLMYETERLLLADVPFIPLYTYVTKRMVNPRLKGWQSNVMDHHYSKDMYFLKAASDQAPVGTGKTNLTEVEAEEAAAAGPEQPPAFPAENDEADLIRQEAEGLRPAEADEEPETGEAQGAAIPEETDSGAPEQTDTGTTEETDSGAPEQVDSGTATEDTPPDASGDDSATAEDTGR
jgi:hypothetical protein